MKNPDKAGFYSTGAGKNKCVRFYNKKFNRWGVGYVKNFGSVHEKPKFWEQIKEVSNGKM